MLKVVKEVFFLFLILEQISVNKLYENKLSFSFIMWVVVGFLL